MTRSRLQRAVLEAATVTVVTLAFMGVSAAEQPPVPASGGVMQLPPLESLNATLERPLFVRGRRPPAVAAEPVVEAPPIMVESDEAPAELTGIVMGPTQAAALLRSRSAEETHLLQRGQTIEEWSLEEIGARHVVLRRGVASVRLQLFEQKEAEQDRPARPRASRPVNAQTRPPDSRRGAQHRRTSQRSTPRGRDLDP